MKIASKLIIGFLIVAIISAIVGGIGIINIISIGNQDTKLFEKNTLGLQYSSDAALYYQRVRFNVVKGLLAAGTDIQGESFKKISDYEVQVEKNLISFEACVVDEEDQRIVDQLKPKWDTYKAMIQDIIDLATAGQNDAAKEMVFGDLQAVANDLQTSFDQFVVMNVDDAQTTADNNKQTVQTSIIMMIGIAAGGIIIALLLGVAISRIIGKPIIMVAGDAEKLAVAASYLGVWGWRHPEIEAWDEIEEEAEL